MGLTSENLVAYLRAEFSKTSRWRVVLFFWQLMIAIPAAISVIVPDSEGDIIYWLAVVGVALLSFWWIFNRYYTRSRSAAHAARRAALILGGFNCEFSYNEDHLLRERFTVTHEKIADWEHKYYYATTLPPGSSRLGEMLEESAFYSEKLQRKSACTMLALIVAFAIIFIFLALGVMPSVFHDMAHTATRVFLAFLVFAMSSDVIGAYFAHGDAADEIKNIRQRLITADANGYPIADVLLAFMDYNNAVESAPESVPFAYKLNVSSLNAQWAEYKRDRDIRRKSRG